MPAALRPARLLATLALIAVMAASCSGEDRPGQVTSEDGGSGTASASGTGTGSASGTGTGGEPATGTAAGDDHHHEDAGFSRDDATQVVEVGLADYAFVDMPAEVKGPRVFFVGRNTGSADHEMLVLDQSGEEVVGVGGIAKGETGTLAAELAPGSYTIECRVLEGSKTHAELGMKSPFVVVSG